jgi:hypothetical protein
MVSNRTQHPLPPPSHTVCIYCILTQGRGRGGVEPEIRLEGNSLQSWVKNSYIADCIANL